jgi:hypothetical protein
VRLLEYRQRLAEVKKRLTPALLEHQANLGKWAVVFQGREDDIKLESSYDVACIVLSTNRRTERTTTCST